MHWSHFTSVTNISVVILEQVSNNLWNFIKECSKLLFGPENSSCNAQSIWNNKHTLQILLWQNNWIWENCCQIKLSNHKAWNWVMFQLYFMTTSNNQCTLGMIISVVPAVNCIMFLWCNDVVLYGINLCHCHWCFSKQRWKWVYLETKYIGI